MTPTHPVGALERAHLPVRIERVDGRSALDEFLRLPWRIYRDDPVWVPPLLHDQRTLLDREKHPFHQHADVEYFLARDAGGEPVGRIAAIVNHLHNEFHEERVGFFGFFESIDDAAVARALLDAAEAWLRERGMQAVRGPMNFSTNEECGLLVEGFEHPPVVMMTHNPPYYEALLRGAGYAKEKDLLAWDLDPTKHGGAPPERLERSEERLLRRAGVTIRPLRMKDFDRELARVEEVYNDAWERNWGFVPMTSAEFAFMAKQLKPVVDPGLCLIMESGDEPVGFALALPDFNQALRHIDGRLLPFGIFKLLWHKRKIDRCRVITLGVKQRLRGRGLDALMYLYYFREAPRLGYPRGECSWILEDNLEMSRALERMGAYPYKTYRILGKPLA